MVEKKELEYPRKGTQCSISYVKKDGSVPVRFSITKKVDKVESIIKIATTERLRKYSRCWEQAGKHLPKGGVDITQHKYFNNSDYSHIKRELRRLHDWL